jgi:hypothetical protein
MKIDLNKEECKKMIIVMLLTDGHVGVVKQGKYKYVKISYWSNDRVLLNLFIELMKKAFDIEPSHVGKQEVYYKRRGFSEKIFDELRKILPRLDKQSSRTSLDFLRNERTPLIKFALRLAMSGEGSISLSRKSNGGLRFHLAFACANLKLCEDWEELFNLFGVRMAIRRDSAVNSGYHGLQVVSEESILNFDKIGFVEGVKIQKGKMFKGMEKNHLLGICVNIINEKKQGKFKDYTNWPNEKFWSIIKTQGETLQG